jgi:type 1 fimbria pilin
MKKWLFATGAMVLLWSVNGYADVPINIKGTILEPVCDVTGIHGETTLTVDFGVQNLEAVGTAEAERPVNLRVTCDNPASTGKALKMYVTPTSHGVLTALGPNVLGTSISGLGISLTAGSTGATPVNLNSWVPVTGVDITGDAPSGEVDLKARLVSANASALPAGVFQAAANVVMSYQ